MARYLRGNPAADRSPYRTLKPMLSDMPSWDVPVAPAQSRLAGTVLAILLSWQTAAVRWRWRGRWKRRMSLPSTARHCSAPSAPNAATNTCQSQQMRTCGGGATNCFSPRRCLPAAGLDRGGPLPLSVFPSRCRLSPASSESRRPARLVRSLTAPDSVSRSRARPAASVRSFLEWSLPSCDVRVGFLVVTLLGASSSSRMSSPRTSSL